MEVLFSVASVLVGVETTMVLPSLYAYLALLSGREMGDDALASTYALTMGMSVMGQCVGTLVANYVANRNECRSMKRTLLLGLAVSIIGHVMYGSAQMFTNSVVIVGTSRLVGGLGASVWSVTSIWQARIVPDGQRTRAVTLCTVGYLFGVLFGPLVNQALDDIDFVVGPLRVDRYSAVGWVQCTFDVVNVVVVLTYFGFSCVPQRVASPNSSTPHVSLACALITTFCTVTILATTDMWISPMCTAVFGMSPTSISWVYLWATFGAFIGTALNVAWGRVAFARSWGYVPCAVGGVGFAMAFFYLARYNVSLTNLNFLSGIIGAVTVPLIIESKSAFSHDVNRVGNAGFWSAAWTYLDLAGTGVAAIAMRAGVGELDIAKMGTTNHLSPTLTCLYIVLSVVVVVAAIVHVKHFTPLGDENECFECEHELLPNSINDLVKGTIK